MDEDYLLALQLQEEFDRESREEPTGVAIRSKGSSSLPSSTSNQNKDLSVIDPSWELIDPNPDARALFMEFNKKFFWGKLDGVEVRWSPRMTLCAGVCSYEGRGGLCSVRLSMPLLKLRPRKDLVETLLHEMIHAYLFVTANNRDRDGHGPEFQKHMHRINNASGAKITIYHSFHDEVDSFRQHWWKCDGPCQNRPPYHGFVKRSMNRAPAPTDFWWPEHQKTCGGTYRKVKEPEGFGEKKKKKEESDSSQDKVKKSSGMDIRSFIGKGNSVGGASSSNRHSGGNSKDKSPAPVSGVNITSGDSKTSKAVSNDKHKKPFVKTKHGGSSTVTVIHAPALDRKANDNKPSNASSSSSSSSKSAQVSTIKDYSPNDGPAPFDPEVKKVKTNDAPVNDVNVENSSELNAFSGQGHKLGGGTIDHRNRRIPGLFQPVKHSPHFERDKKQNDLRDKKRDNSNVCDKISNKVFLEKKKQALRELFSSDSDSEKPQHMVNKPEKSGFAERKSLEKGKKSCVIPKDQSDDSDIDDDISLISGQRYFDRNDQQTTSGAFLNQNSSSSSSSTSKQVKRNTNTSEVNVKPKPLFKRHGDFESRSKKRQASDSSSDGDNGSYKKARTGEPSPPDGSVVSHGNPVVISNLQQQHSEDMLQTCPVCQQQFLASYINTHLDMCLQ